MIFGSIGIVKVFFTYVFYFSATGSRLFSSVFLLCIFTLTMGYRGSLSATLSVSVNPKPIGIKLGIRLVIPSFSENDHSLMSIFLHYHLDTIEQLVADPRPVTSFGPNFKNNLPNSQNPIIEGLRDKYEVHFDFDEAYSNMSKGLIVMAESQQNLQYVIRQRFTNK